MARWLNIPSKKKRLEQDVPEPYEIVCVCGVRLSGYRRKSHYRHACEQCDEVYFILPRNSFPKLKAKKKKQPPRQQQVAELILNSSVVKKLREKREQNKASRQSPKSKEKVADKPKISPFELPPPRIRLITPFRGILAGIVLIVGVTGYWVVHSRNLEQAAETLKSATDEGNAFLKQGDLPAANDSYQKAFQALAVLGRTDQSSNEIRQKSRELQAITSQAVSPLFELADEAVYQIKQSDAESWKSLFRTRYEGTWMIFETSLIPVTDEDQTQPARFRLNLPVLLDGYTLFLELTEPSFVGYIDEHLDQPLIFAAQISSFEQAANQTDVGIIQLDGKTAFLWSHLNLYEQLGFQFDEFHNRKQIENILQQQTRYLRLSK